MSLVWERPCEHDEVKRHAQNCMGGERVVLDSSNLPEKAVEAAAKAAYLLDGEVIEDGNDWDGEPDQRLHYIMSMYVALAAFFQALEEQS